MAKLIKFYETIIDELGIEIIVGGTIENSASQIEECHGYHEVGGGYHVTLTSVEIVISGKGIDILPQLSQKQINKIIDEINVEEVSHV
jgi:hypothetical protein